jgi:purine-binding chemotaxis protein CheW
VSEQRFLLFRAAGEGFAFSLQEVAEVMEPQESFPIPRAPQHFAGLINFHGAPTALVDLARYLGWETSEAPGKVLVLDSRLAALALQVEGVHAIVGEEAVLERAPGEDPLTAERLETEQGRFRLLRLDRLLMALEQGL